MTENEIKKRINNILKNNGFEKKGNTWYLNTHETILVINLQKEFATQLFINVGIFLKRIEEIQYPKINKCHIYFRADSFFLEQREMIRQACSLSYGSDEDVNKLLHFIENDLMIFLKTASSFDELKKIYEDGTFKRGFVFVGLANLFKV